MPILSQAETSSFNSFLDSLSSSSAAPPSSSAAGPSAMSMSVMHMPLVASSSFPSFSIAPPIPPLSVSPHLGYSSSSMSTSSAAAAAAAAEEERLERMRQQTRDLEQWIAAQDRNGSGSAKPSSSRRFSVKGKERERDSTRFFEPNAISSYTSTSTSPPSNNRAKSSSNARTIQDVENTMRQMRQAEIRAGFGLSSLANAAVVGAGGSLQTPSVSPVGSSVIPTLVPPPYMSQAQLPTSPLVAAPPSSFTNQADLPALLVKQEEHSPPAVVAESVASTVKAAVKKKRPRASLAASTSSTRSKPSASTSKAPPVLLTADQKRANHILSEQKRRAAIRNGYNALCEAVPALKAAVDEFEERQKKGRRGRSGGALSGGIEVGGEKVDGRAGPRSEAIVLGQTVEHIRQLLATRSALLERLANIESHVSRSGLGQRILDDSDRIWYEKWDEEAMVEDGEGEEGEGGYGDAEEGDGDDDGEWSEDE